MKSLIFKIVSVVGAILTIFIAGSRSGKSKEQTKQLKKSVENVKKAKNIENSITKLSRDDKLNRL